MRLRALLVSLAAVLGAATGVLAQPPDTVFLEELTWTELRDAIRAGRTVAIVPIGGTEQNGPHMALGKHNVRVKALAERIARALGTALVAPVIAYVPEGRIDPPTGHMRFPGTLSVPDDAFQRIVEHAARSLRAHGFRDVVLLGDHGSTQTGQKAVATRLNREWAATPVRVHAIEEYYRASEAGFDELLRQRGYRAEELGAHAGLADTSLMLAVDPPAGAARPRGRRERPAEPERRRRRSHAGQRRAGPPGRGADRDEDGRGDPRVDRAPLEDAAPVMRGTEPVTPWEVPVQPANPDQRCSPRGARAAVMIVLACLTTSVGPAAPPGAAQPGGTAPKTASPALPLAPSTRCRECPPSSTRRISTARRGPAG